MFARVKKSGSYQYLQLVENRWENGKTRQSVITTLGRLDQMAEKSAVEALIRSLSRFSEKTMLILSDRSNVSASAKKIGPALIFERLWKELGIGSIVSSLAIGGNRGTPMKLCVYHLLQKPSTLGRKLLPALHSASDGRLSQIQSGSKGRRGKT
jgi:hypothetical protein